MNRYLAALILTAEAALLVGYHLWRYYQWVANGKPLTQAPKASQNVVTTSNGQATVTFT